VIMASNWKKHVSASSLALALALAGASRAQAQDNKPATDPAAVPAPAEGAAPAAPAPAVPPADAPKDPGGWKGAPAPSGQDPLANPGTPPAAPAPATPAAPADPNLIPNDDPRSGRIIDKNYNEALKTYDNVLKNDGESVEDLDHRISVNEKLIADYKKKLADSNETKRRLQIELMNRTFYLKQQKDKGAIPEDTYNNLILKEDKNYKTKTANANSDIEFLTKEIADAEKRLQDLRAERRIRVTTTKTNFAAKGPGARKPPVPRSTQLVTSLKDRLQKLVPYEPRYPMDNAPVCEECLRPGGGGVGGPSAGPPAPAADAPSPPTAAGPGPN